jgi:hypothetical protein
MNLTETRFEGVYWILLVQNMDNSRLLSMHLYNNYSIFWRMFMELRVSRENLNVIKYEICFFFSLRINSDWTTEALAVRTQEGSETTFHGVEATNIMGTGGSFAGDFSTGARS